MNKSKVQINTSSYGRNFFREAISREFSPYYARKFSEPEIFWEPGAQLDTDYVNLIKENVIRNYQNGFGQIQVNILGDKSLVLECLCFKFYY